MEEVGTGAKIGGAVLSRIMSGFNSLDESESQIVEKLLEQINRTEVY